jgi:hypothetical protein
MRWLDRYRLRSIGEGVFGSLTVWLGDRLKSWLRATSTVRIGARIMAYLVEFTRELSFLCRFWWNFWTLSEAGFR